jgi:branched-chain amino acid transport system ATP-binding protein
MTVLEVTSLTARHGLLTAVEGVSFSIEKGEVLALIGANGAGKSTLLRAIAGAHRDQTGSVTLNGASLAGIDAHKRVQRGLVLVPEGRKLFSQMNVWENLCLGAQVGRPGVWTPNRIFDVFDNLEKRRFASCLHLSGGEQQAVAIGRALVSNPDLIMLDEVSLGLSPAIVDRVYAILPELRARGTAVIVVEQDLGRALAVADHVICMLEGKIVLSGKADQLKRDDIINAYFGMSRTAAPTKHPIGEAE